MKLYGRSTSLNVQKVLWLLEELGLSYEHIELGGKFGGLDTEEFSRLNPMKKVPVLIDDDHVIWESHTILRYLAASYGDETWYPASPYRRSLYERWMDWAQTLLQPAFMGTFGAYYRTLPPKRNMATVDNELQKCLEYLNCIEQALDHAQYLAGESITLADICAGVIIYRLTSQGLDVSLPPKVSLWYEGLQQRPGYQKWVMSDFSDLRAREEN